jgi:hypothetical protein
MVEVIIALVVGFIAIGLLIALFKFVIYAIMYAVVLSMLFLFGLQIGLGYLANKLIKTIGIRREVLVLIALALLVKFVILPEVTGLESIGSLNYLEYAVPSLLFLVAAWYSYRRITPELKKSPQIYFIKKTDQFYIGNYGSIFIVLSPLIMPELLGYVTTNNTYIISWYFGLGSAIFSSLITLYLVVSSSLRFALSKKINEIFSFHGKFSVAETLSGLVESSALDAEEVETIFNGTLVKYVTLNKCVELELNSARWVFDHDDFCKKIALIAATTEKNIMIEKDHLAMIVADAFDLSRLDSLDFIDRYIDFGSINEVDERVVFVNYIHTEKLNFCVSCGYAVVTDIKHYDWFCSDLCRQTEEVCANIKEKDYDDFIADASTTGLIITASAAKWSENHKIFASGGQGHGFAAENGNNMADKLSGKNSRVIGGDNAKNGADRIVDGQLVQTKYLSTGARSVGAAFDGMNGDYRYLDNNGKPMQLEVPKDQYTQAVKTMQQKIRAGKVPGITDENHANELVRKGHLTYDQAKNIVRFGTIESISYDIIDGAIIGLSAGGISFGITLVMNYINTRDVATSIRTSIIQGGKTFGKSLTMYVTAQQLHRITVVQNVLTKIDISCLSPTGIDMLKRGMNLDSVNAINKALRGTVITSVVLISITTGPDFIRLVRGRISHAQFIKNLAVTTSGVVGGTAGSFAGAALLAPLGPLGIMAGMVVGGAVAGSISATLMHNVTKKYIREDREEIMAIVEKSAERLITLFLLSEEEIDCFSGNLANVCNEEFVQIIFSSKERKALVNFYLKPMVVSVIKQRPSIVYSHNDIIGEYKVLGENIAA